MQRIRSAVTDHIHCARRGERGGDIQGRACHLKLADRLIGDVRRGGAHRFVGYIDSVDLHPGSGTGAAGNAHSTVGEGFGRVDGLTVADGNTRCKDRQVHEVAAEQRKVLYLFLGDNRIHRLPAGVHRHRFSFHLNDIPCLSNIECDVPIDDGSGVNFDVTKLFGGETRCLHPDAVGAWHKVASRVQTCGVCIQPKGASGRGFRHRYGGIRHYGSAWVGNYAFNSTGGSLRCGGQQAGQKKSRHSFGDIH